MLHVEGHFSGCEGVKLFQQSWLPAEDPRAVVALVHGVGEHSGRYMRVVEPLAGAGFGVCAFDQRGHGRSPGRRVHIESWTQYRDDLAAFLETVSSRFPGTPIVIYGHSMGSLVVLDYLLERKPSLAGAVISGVAIEPVGVGSPLQITLARTLTGVLPKLSIDLGIAPESLTRDPEALEARRRDPLVTGRATVRWGTESLDTVERVKSGLTQVDLPLLVLHGQEDPLNRVDGARELFEAASHTDKRLSIYPDTYHEPHNDLAHARVASDVIEWVSHLSVKGA